MKKCVTEWKKGDFLFRIKAFDLKYPSRCVFDEFVDAFHTKIKIKYGYGLNFGSNNFDIKYGTMIADASEYDFEDVEYCKNYIKNVERVYNVKFNYNDNKFEELNN